MNHVQLLSRDSPTRDCRRCGFQGTACFSKFIFLSFHFPLRSPQRLARTPLFQVKSSTSLSAKSPSVPFLEAPANLEGMVGNKGFDPAGFSNYIDTKWLREAELKHGRVCMLATLGFVFAEISPLPG